MNHDWNPYFVAAFVAFLAVAHSVGGWLCVHFYNRIQSMDRRLTHANNNFIIINAKCDLDLKVDD